MIRRRRFPRRGSVYRVALDPSIGHEIRKTRPAVVISNDHMNEMAGTVLVMPITSGRFAYYHWIAIDPPEGGMTRPSSIVTKQIRAVDKRRLGRQLGVVRLPTMQRIEQAIRDHFGLPEGGVVAP
ncbi:MAG: type II toxin-antitoxin system PemK/MazF family toxin [Planctomycetia bacterium]|nr:type II toxin-antitoxin system PemK/MazF family toxin [Planctomycetia bacterium]